MCTVLKSNIWLLKEPENKSNIEVIKFIENEEPIKKDIVVLHCGNACDIENSIPLMYYLFDLCLQFKIFKNEKVMFLDHKDYLQAIELCVEKQKIPDDVIDSQIKEKTILDCHETYTRNLLSIDNTSENKTVLLLQEFLVQNNCLDAWKIVSYLQKYKSCNQDLKDLLANLKFLIWGTTEEKIFKEILYILGNDDVVSSIIIETPLNLSHPNATLSLQTEDEPSPEIVVSAETIKIEEVTGEEIMQLDSATKEYVVSVFTAFLSLLVNSRNELTLSRVMISPFIDLSHEAFTHLKHLAAEKEMPMCQTALSYVMRVRLGGKGYAPPADCPLFPHLKNLEIFVDTLNQLQTIIEEDPIPWSAIRRIINILKKKLLKCGSNKLKSSAIEKATCDLHSVVEKVNKTLKYKQFNKASPQICQETLDILYYLVNYIFCSNCSFDPKKIFIQKQCERTPINLPPLLGYFRSPEEESSCAEDSVINEDSVMSDNSLGSLPPLMSYFHHSDNSCSVSNTCDETQTPTKTSFRDSIKKSENNEETEIINISQPKNTPNRKRSILGDVTNDPDKAKKCKKSVPLKEKPAVKGKEIPQKKIPKKEIKKTKLSKKFKLLEGQGRITNFFTTTQK